MRNAEDPRCPECGEPIGQTATYCMHCSADLTDEQAAADTDQDEAWETSETGTARSTGQQTGDPTEQQTGGIPTASSESSDQLLDPDGILDNTLTVIVGIAGGVVVGIVGTFTFLSLTGSAWALPFGLVAWLGSTAYLVRRRTVQGAVSKSGYAVALVLLAVPLIALSPVASVEGGIEARGGLFVFLLAFAAVPAAFAAVIGWVAGRFVPDNSGSR